MIPLTRGTRIAKFIETESKMVVTRAWAEEGMESYHLKCTELQFHKMKKF